MSERCPVCVYKLTPWANNTEGSPRGWTCVNCGLQFFPRTLALARATRDREIAAAVAEAVKPLMTMLQQADKCSSRLYLQSLNGGEKDQCGSCELCGNDCWSNKFRALLDPPAPKVCENSRLS